MTKRTLNVYLKAWFLSFSTASCSGTGDQQQHSDSSDDSEDGLNGTDTSPGDTNENPEVRDECPDNPDKTEPGFCGCGTPEGRCCDTLASDFVKTLGAKYYLYRQPYLEDLDIDSLTPDDTRIVQIGSNPAVSGEHFVVLKGHVKLNQGGSYEFRPGWDDSTFNMMTVAGQEVHQKNLSQQEGVQTPIYLSQGYPTRGQPRAAEWRIVYGEQCRRHQKLRARDHRSVFPGRAPLIVTLKE